MNHAGEIAALAALARPTAAVVTNAGSAHLEGLGSLEAIAREKASLVHALREGQPAFVGADSPRLLAAVRGREGARRHLRARRGRRRAAGSGRGSRRRGLARARRGISAVPAAARRAATRCRTRSRRSRWRATGGSTPRAVAGGARGAARRSRAAWRCVRARGARDPQGLLQRQPGFDRARRSRRSPDWPGATRRIALLGDMLELGAAAAATAPRDRRARCAARSCGQWARTRETMPRGPPSRGMEARVFADKPQAARRAARGARRPASWCCSRRSRGAALEQVLDGIDRES